MLIQSALCFEAEAHEYTNIQEMEWVSLFSDPQRDDDSLITLKDEKITVKNYIVPWWKKVKTLEN
ncbi:hypothetical protein CWI53_09415 [Neisseria meningitidis]|nr:hypothetical protein [Neisseria meningitidis]MBG8720564.1 hypothetical protein [Neisseria meningitidis]PKT92069.1 hypothetical protein CWI53_09415 [Neisseria meningitidis]PKT97229.1 hypothetical protein CWI46_11080 [Neisseria meningitidis]PKT99574.1 hypothetical protein CWI43_08405 [Neisseria meningitidis]